MRAENFRRARCAVFVCVALTLACAVFVCGCGRRENAQRVEVKPQSEAGAVAGLTAEQVAELDGAFADLQDGAAVDPRNTKKTDDGYRRLKKMGASNPAARAYIAEKLPALISPESGPTATFDPRWRNELDLADDLTIVEAAPAMIRRIEWGRTRLTGLSDAYMINHQPAAMALVDLGDPAVPALKDGLEHGDKETPFYCALVLEEIGTPAATDALVHSNLRKKDPELYKQIMEDMKAKQK
jgi:hypothetical protein